MNGSASIVTNRDQRVLNSIDNAIDDVLFGERDGKVGKYLLKADANGMGVYVETQSAPVVTGPRADVRAWLQANC